MTLQLLPEADGVALKVLDDILCEILQELLTKALEIEKSSYYLA